MKKGKNIILPALTSLVLLSCAVFVFCVYNHSNNAKALTETAAETEINDENDGSSNNITETDSDSESNFEFESEDSGITESDNTEELRGVWISFLDFSSKGYTRTSFTKHIKNMFAQCKEDNFNTVFVHVRMFSDAMYNSDYFPWSSMHQEKLAKALALTLCQLW